MEVWLTIFLVMLILSIGSYLFFSDNRKTVIAILATVWSLFVGAFTFKFSRDLKRRDVIEEIEEEFNEEEPNSPDDVADDANELIDRLRRRRGDTKGG